MVKAEAKGPEAGRIYVPGVKAIRQDGGGEHSAPRLPGVKVPGVSMV